MIDKPVMIITGTRKGIGKYLAEYYVEKKYQVITALRMILTMLALFILAMHMQKMEI